MPDLAAPEEDTSGEVARLVRQLHETQRRLQELGGGELDAVLHPGGQSYLLHDAQERLRQSEASQRDLAAAQASILNALPAHIALLDRHGIILAINEGWQATDICDDNQGVGAPVGSSYLQACDCATGRFAEHSAEATAGVRAVLEDGQKGFAMEYPCEGPTGEHWYRLMVNQTGSHGLGGAVVMHLEITDQKNAERLLAQSEQRLSLATKSAGMGIWDWNVETNQMIWDEQMRHLHGIRPEDFSGAVDAWQKGLHPEDRVRSENELAAALAGADFNTEFRVRWPSGEVHHIEAHGVVLRSTEGKVQRMIGVNWDVTERKRMEARFRRLVSSDVQGIFFWNTAGEVTGGNDAFLRLARYTRDELEAGSVNWAAMTPPEYADADRRALKEIASNGVSSPYEKEWIRPDGSRVAVLIGAAVFEDNPTEGVCFVIDLTERKQLERQFLRVQRMESIGTLAGGIAHDLNNTLSPIIMSLDILAAQATDPDTEKLLDILSTSARRGANMVRQVLSFARGVEGERKEMQIKHLVHEIENIVRDTFPKNIRITSGIPNDLWTILGDATQLHQVLLNLCVNARDAMPGGGKIIISAENLVVDEHYAGMNPDSVTGAYILLHVEDTGTGIAPEHIERIFDPFFTTKEIDKGTGLGLSTTAAIVKSHGGFLRVYSELGQGTRFKVFLRAETDPGAELARQEPVLLPPGHGELILVVDDEEAVRLVTQRTLEGNGYRVIVAADGAEALATFAGRRTEIAAVLTDMMMPVMDGPALIQVLRRMDPPLPIIAASGLLANEQVTKAAAFGVKHFLAKPYTASVLLKTLEELLAPRRRANS